MTTLRRSTAHAILGSLLLLAMLAVGLAVSEQYRIVPRPTWTLLPPNGPNVLHYSPVWDGFGPETWELDSYRDGWTKYDHAEYLVSAADRREPPFMFCYLAVPYPTNRARSSATAEWQTILAKVRSAIEADPGIERRAVRGELTESDLRAMGL